MTWTAPADRDRGLGALWGLALGDALGTTTEFTAPPAPPYPALATGPLDDIVGGGPFSLAPGEVTDDTQLAAALAQSLIVCDGDLDRVDLAARFVDWQRHAFDVGSQIGAALRRLGTGASVDDAARAVWLERGKDAAGNGGLMRAAPLAVAYCARPDALIDAALAEAALTHFDPRCRLAQAAYDAAIAAAVRPDGAPTAAAMLAAARAALDEAAARLDAVGDDRDRITAAHAALTSDLDAATADDPGLYGERLHLHRHQGFVRVAFRLAFWQLVHAPDFAAGVIDVANRGGDADTNAAIVGALLGARDGLATLPRRWVERVHDARPPDEALATRYHPRALVELVP
ncbi:MAG: ADP-ribosylglycohydrolase family protein [Myxococcales bacterium]|nr:ADP-ribosylglycohydrolase family protein [Myxococcales bacterium]MBK7196593.1 ADP-ribosylglycohydrolase family protein [Myxococcales bacterium]